MSRAKTAVTIGDGQAKGGEGERDATLVAGGDKKTQPGRDGEQGPNAFVQPFLLGERLHAFGEKIHHCERGLSGAMLTSVQPRVM